MDLYKSPLLKYLNDSESISNRIAEIELQLSLMPIVSAGNPLQAIKHSFSCEKRRLKIKLSAVNGKSHTFKQGMQLIQSVNGVCAICGDNKKPSIDHIISIHKGGHDGIENLRVLCISCNSRKGGKNAK